MKKFFFLFALLACAGSYASATEKTDKVVIAYVTSWTHTIPDPTIMTHINYAFGHVNETFNGVGIDNPDRLRKIVALKKKSTDLKVLLSIGGWGSGRFSEMAADSTFRSCIRYIDFVNVMSYDMGNPPYHHSALYPSDITNWMTTSTAINAHLAAGVPREKLVMGMPLYGRGKQGYSAEPDSTKGVTEQWHSQSMVPYLVDAKGEFVMGFENERSLGIKCQYIIDHRLRGGMYWEYGDEKLEKLRNVICRILMRGEAGPYSGSYAGGKVRFRTLIIWDPSAESAHVEFDKQAIRFFHKLSYGEGFTYDVRTESPASLDTLKRYQVVVMLNALPHGEAARKAFQQYMESGGEAFIDATQNLLFTNAFRWVAFKD